MLDRPGYPVAQILGGINRSREAANTSLLDARDVFEETGTLRVRRAWKSLGSGPVALRPASLAQVYISGSPVPTRTFTQASVGDAIDVFVYALSPFDGIRWGEVTGAAFSGTTSRYLRVFYSIGQDQWQEMPWILDQTQGVLVGGTRRAPLLRAGDIHWHQPADWATTDVGGSDYYGIRLRPVALGNGVTDTDADWTGYTFSVVQPGIQVFDRHAVNGLFAGRIANTVMAVVCADNVSGGALEPGALIGKWALNHHPTEQLHVHRRWTAGDWGVVSIPNAGGGGFTTQGTTSRFTDRGPVDQPDGYDSSLYDHKPAYTIEFPDLAPTGSLGTTLFETTDARLLELEDDALRHFILVCTTSGGGPAVGEARQIVASVNGGSATLLANNPAWSAAPTTSTRFAVLRPTHVLQAKGQSASAKNTFAIGSTAGATLTPDTNSYSNNPTNTLGNNAPVHFAIATNTRWTVPAGRFYSFCNHPTSGDLILSNGHRLFTFNGEFLRELTAAREDDPRTEKALGALPSVGPGNTSDPRTLAYDVGFYRTPPAGKFLATHLTYIFVSGFSDYPNEVRWSMPGDYCDLWPKVNAGVVHCPYGEPIVGMAHYYDRLIVFTRRSIHEAVPTTTGFDFRLITNASGFCGHRAVQSVPFNGHDVLLGVTPGGLIALSGTDPVKVIETWDLAMPAPGLDANDLQDAPSVFWSRANLFIQAFKLKGSTSRNRLLVLNVESNRLWIWTAPFGVASMTIVSSPSGEEELLIGSEDGLLSTLIEGDTDDGQALTGFLQTHPLSPSKTAESVELNRVSLEARVESATKSATLTVYRNEATTRWTTGATPLSTGEAVFGTGTFTTSNFATEDFARRQVNMPNGTVGRSFSIALTLQPRTFIRNLTLDAVTHSRER